MKIYRIEFDDPDDPESGCHPNSPIRIRITPEGMVIGLPNGGSLRQEDQVALGQMLRLAYEQGKRIGQLVEQKKGTKDV